jgi:hypothetical protein
LFKTISASIRFLGGMNLAFAAFAALLLANRALFPGARQSALFAAVFFARACQSVRVQRARGPRGRKARRVALAGAPWPDAPHLRRRFHAHGREFCRGRGIDRLVMAPRAARFLRPASGWRDSVSSSSLRRRAPRRLPTSGLTQASVMAFPGPVQRAARRALLATLSLVAAVHRGRHLARSIVLSLETCQ